MISETNNVRRLAWLSALIGAVGMAGTALAAGTDAGLDITNTATVSFRVGSATQPTVNSTADTFKVDKKVIFTVAEANSAPTIVQPAGTGQVLKFNLANTSNATVAFNLTATNEANGSSTTLASTNYVDGFDTASHQIYVDANGNGSYDGPDTLVAGPVSLTEDQTVAVFVVGTMPNSVADGANANVRLRAVSTETATVGGDTPNVVDVVFADTGRDNTEEAVAVYSAQSAALTATKSSAVISDPVNGTNSPKRIPQSVVEYTVVVANGGSIAAQDVAIGDSIDAALTLLSGVYNSGASNVEITAPSGAVSYCVAETGGADSNGDGCVFGSGTLTIAPGGTGLTIPAGATGNTATFRFRVQVN